MNKILMLGVFLIYGGINLCAQQAPQYTQFMYDKLRINPGYAGSASMPCISCIHRTQWSGLDGAPVTTMVNAHFPFLSKRIGMGASIVRDQIGPAVSWDYSMMYSYKIPLKKGALAIGLKGSIRSYSVDFPSLQANSMNDDLLMMENTKLVRPNFGAGIYYESQNWYVGISAQDLVNNELIFNNQNQQVDVGKEQTHYYLMSGLVTNITSNVKFKPSLLLKYTQQTPLDLDAHAAFIFFDKLSTGLTYRMGGFVNTAGESLDFVLQYQVTPRLRFGFAYDYSIGMIRSVNSGSFEFMAHHCLGKKMDGVTNPRYF